MKTNKNLKWFINHTVKNTRYIGGSYRSGVEINGPEALSQYNLTTNERIYCFDKVTTDLRKRRDYRILICIFIDGEERSSEPFTATVKSIIPSELDEIIHNLIVDKLEETIQSEDWAYAFVASPNKSTLFTEEEIDSYHTLWEKQGIWDQKQRKEILHANRIKLMQAAM